MCEGGVLGGTERKRYVLKLTVLYDILLCLE